MGSLRGSLNALDMGCSSLDLNQLQITTFMECRVVQRAISRMFTVHKMLKLRNYSTVQKQVNVTELLSRRDTENPPKNVNKFGKGYLRS